jgi:sulfatase modifying factor 1
MPKPNDRIGLYQLIRRLGKGSFGEVWLARNVAALVAVTLMEVALKIPHSGGKTHPVGGKKPNSFGLYDLQGNVWEWCSDWYDNNYYTECMRQGIVIDPGGTGAGSFRVMRGGSWYSLAAYCRSAYRNYGSPGHYGDDLEFRLVRIGR